ncbi:MAG: terminase large subunit [Kordiimonadaceae bacterium]|nr:terminase large subunit [Kordiimonadaceae bacterium]
MGAIVTRQLDYVDRANRYIKNVLSGKQPVCRLTRLTIERQKRDLVSAKKKAWPFRFDRSRASQVCEFLEEMPHTKGRWAQKKLTLKLEDWQCFEICCIFGWVRKKKNENGIYERRYTKAYLKVPRKNGKSIKVAGIGNYMFLADGEYGAEVYCGATTEKQAWEVYGPAKKMVEKRTELIDHFGVDVRAKNMNTVEDGSKFEPVIGKPGDGASPSCAIVDEYHEHPDDTQYDTFETGMGARDQPLAIVITTAGDNIGGPCYDLESHCEQVLEGTIEDEQQFVMIFGTDPEDDWKSELALIKANPNYGVSVRREFLLSQQKQAINRPSKRGVFRTKHLNQWVGAKDAYFDLEKWKAGYRPDLWLRDMEGGLAICPELQNQYCIAQLDLASKKDLCALTLLFPIGEGSARTYRTVARYYVPESALEEESNKNYRKWVDIEHPWLTVTPGNITDYEYIEEDLKRLKSMVEIADVAYDPFQATQFSTRLMAEGFPMVEYGNTVKNMSEPMKHLDASIIAGKVLHEGNPVTAWCLSNVVSRRDKKENDFPDKNKVEQKIDGAVAMIMGFGRDIVLEGTTGEDSYLNAGELLVLN